MPVPMGDHTACVCDSMGSALAPSGDFMGAFKNHSGVPRDSCGFYRAGHAARVKLHRNTHGFLVPRPRQREREELGENQIKWL